MDYRPHRPVGAAQLSETGAALQKRLRPVAELGAELLAFIIQDDDCRDIGSPGYHCLAIDFDGKVNQDVKARETILTIVLGVLVIAGGRH